MCLMPSEEENCHLVTVTEEEIENCVRVIPRLDTLILVKAMGHRKRFGNPFKTGGDLPIGKQRKTYSIKNPTYSPPIAIANGQARHDLSGLSESLSKLNLSADDNQTPKSASARQ
ncbi:hypothetical protein DICVIV_10022 [Dictyocaulus viviparus]|uniref:Uncharacterized protein n=1 Tax=Dictyocaulus viviparus TaxID=29172 RepID=A0A0D8XNK0_DICVI|nr:hypothetical protein DICVIV_10022 [Dictyocaulus viviparus]